MSNKGFFIEGKQTRKMEDNNAYQNRVDMRNKEKQKRYIRRKWFLNHIKFNCQLYRGDSKFPRTQEMTCREMGQDNNKFIKSFIKAMDKEKEQPLWVWKIIDTDAFKTRMRKIVVDNNREVSEC